MMVGGSFMQEMKDRELWIPTNDDYNMMGFGGCMHVCNWL
jgi:hypothetical protein